MAFTASDVKTLRERTGCGMMDCKKALTEADGDMEKAIEVLREKGLAAVAKKAGRIAAEGIVVSVVDKEKKVGVVLEVNSETDFVAKNADFVAFVNRVAKVIVDSNPADVEALMSCKDATGEDVASMLQEKVLTIGENIQIRRFERLEGDMIAYVHGEGRIGVMVMFDTDVADKEGFEAYGKDVAMQVAALNAKFVSQDEISEEYKEHEKAILLEQIKNDPKESQKPEKVINGMIMGRLNKEFKEVCLLDQVYVKAEDGKQSVAKYLEEVSKEVGAPVTLKKFVRFETGEGLEKKEENFAEEVAAQMK